MLGGFLTLKAVVRLDEEGKGNWLMNPSSSEGGRVFERGGGLIVIDGRSERVLKGRGRLGRRRSEKSIENFYYLCRDTSMRGFSFLWRKEGGICLSNADRWIRWT